MRTERPGGLQEDRRYSAEDMCARRPPETGKNHAEGFREHGQVHVQATPRARLTQSLKRLVVHAACVEYPEQPCLRGGKQVLSLQVALVPPDTVHKPDPKRSHRFQVP